VSVALTFDSVRAGQGGTWRLVDGFDDPARWYSLNDNAYEPADSMTATTAVDGAALSVSVDAPSSGVTLGIGHASVTEALPALVTPGALLAAPPDAPSSGVTLGIGHASVPEALPALVTPGFLRAVSAEVGRVVRVPGP